MLLIFSEALNKESSAAGPGSATQAVLPLGPYDPAKPMVLGVSMAGKCYLEPLSCPYG